MTVIANNMRLLVLLAALVVAPSAATAELRVQQATLAVQIASGVPSPDVSCEATGEAWLTEVQSVGAPPNSDVGGYTLGARVRLAPWVCRNLDPRTSLRFGEALYVLGVEAARLAGHRGPGSEAMAGCWGLLWSADLARRVWGVEFFTPTSERVMANALERHRGSLDRYRLICA